LRPHTSFHRKSALRSAAHTHTHTHTRTHTHILFASPVVVHRLRSDSPQPPLRLDCFGGNEISLRSRRACCNVLQCVAVCRSVLQRVAVCCNMVQCVAVCCSKIPSATLATRLFWRAMQSASTVIPHDFVRVAVCCSVWQCVEACCNAL